MIETLGQNHRLGRRTETPPIRTVPARGSVLVPACSNLPPLPPTAPREVTTITLLAGAAVAFAEAQAAPFSGSEIQSLSTARHTHTPNTRFLGACGCAHGSFRAAAWSFFSAQLVPSLPLPRPHHTHDETNVSSDGVSLTAVGAAEQAVSALRRHTSRPCPVRASLFVHNYSFSLPRARIGGLPDLGDCFAAGAPVQCVRPAHSTLSAPYRSVTFAGSMARPKRKLPSLSLSPSQHSLPSRLNRAPLQLALLLCWCGCCFAPHHYTAARALWRQQREPLRHVVEEKL